MRISSQRIFRPTLTAGVSYARALGAAAPFQSVGGIAELIVNTEETIIKQPDFSRAGGGTRAQVNRIDSCSIAAKLQDLNPVNLARASFGNAAAVQEGTVTAEAVVAHKGGLIRLAHLNPSTVVLKNGETTIAAAGNYEVRPEGLFVFDDAPGITEGEDGQGMALTVDYAHSGYDVIEALVTAAPTLEWMFAGVNEAMDGAPSTVEFYRVKMGALRNWGLVSGSAFAELEMAGEVLMDPTKTGAGISRFYRVRMT